MAETKYAYTLDEDNPYQGSFTLEEAKEQACADIQDRATPGETWRYYIGEVQHPIDAITKYKRSYSRIGERILELLEEMCFDELMSDDEILRLTDDQQVELGKLACNFVKDNATINWFSVTKIQTFTYTVLEDT